MDELRGYNFILLRPPALLPRPARDVPLHDGSVLWAYCAWQEYKAGQLGLLGLLWLIN